MDLSIFQKQACREVSDTELSSMMRVLLDRVAGSDISSDASADIQWVMERVAAKRPVDGVRIASRVKEIHEVKRALRRHALGQFAYPHNRDNTWLGDGVLSLSSKRVGQMSRSKRRVLIAHELGHAATFEYDMLVRLPGPASSNLREVVSELCANMHVYRWGLGRQMRRQQNEILLHLPGLFVTVDRKRFKVTNRWTLHPAT